MIFDYIYTFPNATTPDEILVQTSSTVNSLIPLFLLFVWGTIFLIGTQRQKSRTGTADYPAYAVIASLSTLILSALLSVTSGLISLDWLVIVLIIAIFSGVWLFIDRRISEG